MLVSFHGVPASEDIEIIQKALHNLLDLPAAGIWLVTTAWHYGSHSSGHLFRADGMVNVLVTNATITPRIRRAIAIRRTFSPCEPVSIAPTITEPLLASQPTIERPPCLLIIWIRQSNRRGDANIGKQAWYILGDLPVDLLPLQPNDEVIIAIEFCSSILHPWNDRTMPLKVLTHIRQSRKDTYILSACADRITRRREEISMIVNHFQQTSTIWKYRGLVEDTDEDEHTDWLDATEGEDRLQEALTNCTYARQRDRRIQLHTKLE